jgi:hypothetical protein
MNKFKLSLFMASLSLAAMLSFSCTAGGGGGGRGYCSEDEDCDYSEYNGGGGSGPGYSVGGSTPGGGKIVTEVYAIKEIRPDFIIVEYPDYECTEEGLKERASSWLMRGFYYSVNNNVLTFGRSGSNVKFNGTSNDIIGTWTRSKNKAAHCKDYYDEYDDEYDYECEDGYDITKFVVTAQTVTATRDMCPTDIFKNGENKDGYTIRVTNCFTATISNGVNTLKMEFDLNKMSQKVTYNGKSCETKLRPTEAERRTACNKAINSCRNNSSSDCLIDAYHDNLDNSACYDNLNWPSDAPH